MLYNSIDTNNLVQQRQSTTLEAAEEYNNSTIPDKGSKLNANTIQSDPKTVKHQIEAHKNGSVA